MRPTLFAFCFTLVLSGSARGDVDYMKEVKPLLAARCYACHGALQQKSGLRLDTVAFMLEGGNKGPIVTPGQSAKSSLIDHVLGLNNARRMPPPADGEALGEKQIALLKAWIDEGAKSPAGEKPELDPREHWAFRTPVRPPVPAVKLPGWDQNPIDAFIAAQLEKQGLTPQSPADRRVLLRRLYLDLVGLPPTLDEQETFLKDNTADAYEKVVDRLLASPQYGQRWGRHWMDIWRYSDWWGLGQEVRNSQKHIWHWRDWIIESLNADKGYDQMVREMLAADELYPNDMDRLRASGFLARHYFKFNRTTWLDETIEHTSKAFLGLTMNCTKCHDHKYDPIAHVDYYRFRAFFEPYQVRTDLAPGEVDLEKNGIPRAFDCNLDTPTYLHIRGDDRNPNKDRKITPGVPPLLTWAKFEIQPIKLPIEAHIPGLRAHVIETHRKAAEKQIEAARLALEQAKKAMALIKEPAAPAKVETPTLEPEAKATVLFRDDFLRPNPDLWETIGGKWQHDKTGLAQSLDGQTRSLLRVRPMVPADFQARLRLTITGGEPYRSVGLLVDKTKDSEILVYVTAIASGPRVQVAYSKGGKYVYPAEASVSWPIKLNEPVDLKIQMRGQLVNVAVNDKHVVTYKVPLPRQMGETHLVTFAATTVFHEFALSTLPDSVVLAPPGKTPAPKATSAQQAKLMLVAAEKNLAAAETHIPALEARVAADRAKFETPATFPEFARKAAALEAQATIARAEADLAQSEVTLLVEPAKKADTEKKRALAQAALAKGRAALKAPGQTYTTLRGALKTPEDNLENEASRMRPFPATSTGRRTALAQWLTDARHPLTARVAVNHIWARHFDKPLVATVFDFGRKGAVPSHPELLDYLAVELMSGKDGWNMKRLHRLMVTSQLYRLSSANEQAAFAKDPENRFYWRMNPGRMESQIIRDSLLHLAGELDLTEGGPSIPVAMETKRRSLYFVHSHNDQQRFLAMFDDASVRECYRRSESIVPQQALTLSNSKLALTTAVKIAERLESRLAKASDADFIRAAFELILASTPTTEEVAECTAALEEFRRLTPKAPTTRARVNLVHALLNHNDFITVR